jgi:hypothetical protein
MHLHARREGGPDALRVPGLYDPVDLNEDDEDDDLVPSTCTARQLPASSDALPTGLRQLC